MLNVNLLVMATGFATCNVLMPSSVVADFPKYLGTSVRGRKLNQYSWLRLGNVSMCPNWWGPPLLESLKALQSPTDHVIEGKEAWR
jgi:hypothetical protein